MRKLKLNVMQEKIVRHQGVSFTAQLVASQPLTEFLTDHQERVYLDLNEADRIKFLTEAHALCVNALKSEEDGNNKSNAKKVAGSQTDKGSESDNGGNGK